MASWQNLLSLLLDYSSCFLEVQIRAESAKLNICMSLVRGLVCSL